MSLGRTGDWQIVMYLDGVDAEGKKTYQHIYEHQDGREAKKVVGQVVYSKTKYGINYQINPMNNFNLSDYFGFECVEDFL